MIVIGISKKVLKYSYLIGAAIAAVLIVRKETGWASGLMIGIIWATANFSLTMNLFETALSRKDPKRIKTLLAIKFPVLYLAGFLILKYRLFPVYSIIAGIGLTLAIIGVVNIWPKRA